jgi:hypothetical protein
MINFNTINKNSKEYLLGYNGATRDDYVKQFGEPIGGSESWVAFLSGTSDKLKEINDVKRKEYKIDEFESKLRELCKEYNVSINFGCGCCGAGATCKDLELNFEIK